MDSKWSAFAIRALPIALIAVTITPIVRSDDDETAKFPSQASTGSSISAPIVVAQGRCFNGRCF